MEFYCLEPHDKANIVGKSDIFFNEHWQSVNLVVLVNRGLLPNFFDHINGSNNTFLSLHLSYTHSPPDAQRTLLESVCVCVSFFSFSFPTSSPLLHS